MHLLLDNPWVAAQIDAAVAPYRKLWSPEAVAAFREEMAATLQSHPTVARLLTEARPETAQESGTVRAVSVDPTDESEPARRDTGT